MHGGKMWRPAGRRWPCAWSVTSTSQGAPAVTGRQQKLEDTRRDSHQSCQTHLSPVDALISDFGPPELWDNTAVTRFLVLCESSLSTAVRPPVPNGCKAFPLVSYSALFPLHPAPPQLSILHIQGGSKREAFKKYIVLYYSSTQNPPVSSHLIQNRNQSPCIGLCDSSPSDFISCYSPLAYHSPDPWHPFFPHTC